MRLYEFTATFHHIDKAALFLGFADNDSGQYLYLHRAEGTQDEVLPHGAYQEQGGDVLKAELPYSVTMEGD